MGERTAIEWTDHTFNPWMGCTWVSAECDNCYAWRALEDGRQKEQGVKWGPGQHRHLTKTWHEPIEHNAAAARDGYRHKLFCASEADVFDAEAPDFYREMLWDLIRTTPNLTWQLLTKRPNLIRKMLPPGLVNAPNIWLGTSVGMGESFGVKSTLWRIAELIKTPAVVHFLSVEPLLGPILNLPLTDIEWVICGGESGAAVCSTPDELVLRRLVEENLQPKPHALEWVRQIRDQVKAGEVPFFFKQWGGVLPKSGGRILDGRTWDEFPEGGSL